MADLITAAGRAVVPRRLRPAVAGVVRPLAHRGDVVACPCCGGTFGSFAAHRNRATAKCPRCGSLERHRLLWLYIAQRTDLLTAPLQVLHFAPERQLQRHLAAQGNLRYRSADLDSALADDRVDITALPYADASFDVVLCSHVLEHVDDDRRAMRELVRILRPGGRAIVLSPIDRRRETTLEDPAVTTPADRLRVYLQEDHARLYGRDFAERLAQAGFVVRCERVIDELPADVVRRHGLRRDDPIFGDEDVFLCTKAAA
jgi:SAM-dependent methyltransferase